MKDLQMEKVIFELDSKLVVDSMHSMCGDITEFGAIISSWKDLLSSFCRNYHVEFTRGQANMVAHTLAKVVISHASPQFFFDY